MVTRKKKAEKNIFSVTHVIQDVIIFVVNKKKKQTSSKGIKI